MAKKQKLELTWVGKENRPKLEPRILIENPELSYHAKARVSDDDIFDNMLIHGDNLLALKALEQEYTGKIKCIFIDPPYNTGSAFSHYDDGVEHSLWLSLMRDRLEIMHRLLSESGSLWITIDDNEAQYLKILCDEIFGRQSFVTTFIWKKVDSPNDNKVPITPDHDYVLCYTRTPNGADFKQMPDESILEAYRKPEEEGRPYRDRLLKKNGKNSLRTDRPSMYFPIEAPNGEEVYPIHDDGREARWAFGQKSVDELIKKDLLVWKERAKDGVKVWVPYTREYAPENPTRPYPTIWSDLDTTRQTKAHHKTIFGYADEFDTPKPENLLRRILNIATNSGDIVLDSFLGSGTTAAAAHKMGRKWIGIELGEHCYSHCVPRLKKVIDGTDLGGISTTKPRKEAVKLCKSCKESLCEKCAEKVGESNKGGELLWKGGGGFRFYELGPSLISEDRWGNPVINPEFNPAMLAEAMCKLEGFTYKPSDEHYWVHGNSTETDFIYVTTQFLGRETLTKISDDVGPERSLLVCCTAFKCNPDDFENLTIKKIPKAVLKKCEWGHDDYSLAVENLPEAPPEPEPQFQETTATPAKKFGKDKTQSRPSLFDFSDGGSN